MKRLAVFALFAAGCSSLIDDPCADGFELIAGVCTTQSGPGSDTQPNQTAQPVMPEGPTTPISPTQPDPPLCSTPLTDCGGVCVDTTSDADNCGACGLTCATGFCQASACVGEIAGHVVAIGHDYQTTDAAMNRVLGDAVGLVTGQFTRIGYWRGSSSLEGAQAAASSGLAQTGRNDFGLELAALDAKSLLEIDTVVIEPQQGSGDDAEAAGTAVAQSLLDFVEAGHVVVVLETTGGVSYRFADGAGLFSVAAPIDVSNTAITVAAPADAV
ncbi:MAG TPA: hypothetical protein VGG28_26210, partial [Kofleriaceae bacterium]